MARSGGCASKARWRGPPALVAQIAGWDAALSLAQGRLSTRARSIRRRAVEVTGENVYADGSREVIDARAMISAPEAALSVLWLASLATTLGLLLARLA